MDPRARVVTLDGQLVLDDPDALACIQAVEKHNCVATFQGHIDRIRHFTTRIEARGLNPHDHCIVVINVDDEHGGPIAERLMPGTDWQPMRDAGQVPFARGIVVRAGLIEVLELFDTDAAEALRSAPAFAAVVIDYGVAAVFTELPQEGA